MTNLSPRAIALSQAHVPAGFGPIDQVTADRAAVLSAINAGNTSSADIASVTGLYRNVFTILMDLKSEGLIKMTWNAVARRSIYQVAQ